MSKQGGNPTYIRREQDRNRELTSNQALGVCSYVIPDSDISGC